MSEFLHQVVAKRERGQEMRSLQDTIFRMPTMGRMFNVPTSLRMPPINEIAYRSRPASGEQTDHCVVFPNIGGWVQSVVSILTPSITTIRSQQMLTLNAWELIAGHSCRPDYRWVDNSYVCRYCNARYATDGSEWNNG